MFGVFAHIAMVYIRIYDVFLAIYEPQSIIVLFFLVGLPLVLGPRFSFVTIALVLGGLENKTRPLPEELIHLNVAYGGRAL